MPSTDTTTVVRRRTSSRRAVKYSVAGTTWRDAFRLAPADATVAPALRVGLASATVLIVGGVFGRYDLAGFATFGALCSAFCRYEPYPRLAGKLAMVGLLLVGSIAFGAGMGVAATPVWLEIGALSLLAGGAYSFMSGFRINGPGPVIAVFAATGAAGYASTASDLIAIVVSGAVGVLVGWAAAMFPALIVPTGPARLAVARAVAAASGLTDSSGSSVASVRASIAHARSVITSSGRIASTVEHCGELTAVLDELESAVQHWQGFGDAAPILRLSGLEDDLRKIKHSNVIRSGSRSVGALTIDERHFVAGLRRICSTSVAVNAARVASASALAGWVAAGAGLEHPLWASMGAIAALQGLDYRHTVQRGIQRLVGNIGGAAIAAVVIALTLGYWQAVVVVVVLQTAAELLVMRSYALTSLAVTPMALTLIGFGAPVDSGVALTRVVDTVIGVVTGIALAAATISRSDYRHLES
ncbi:hypothetical protein ABH922_004116 [Rhodococcus sp. 27YEA15]|uniref:FUSC family protein n=1 Tax=Rhodococcus sp. 27YEA15 TaxID=3156259 RepID=UPI003C7E486A